MTEVLQSNVTTTPVAAEYGCFDDEVDEPQPSTMKSSTAVPSEPQSQPSSARSNGRRSEAFLMTGDKILNLNNKISPLYAAAYRDQLPPDVEIASPQKPDEFVQTNGYLNEVPAVFKSAGTLDNYETTPKRRMNRNRQGDQSFDSSKNSILTLPENAIHSTNDATFTKVPSFLNPKYLPNKSSVHEPSTSGISSPTTMDRIITKYDSGNGTSISLSQPLFDLEKLAKAMYDLNGYTKSDVTDVLLKSDSTYQGLAERYFNQFNFTGMRLDVGLRHFLDHVCLKGESSDRANLLESFADRYYESNPTLFSNNDQVHTLTCALILLNTDLHGENIGKKMTVREFISNLEHTEYSFEKHLLRSLYNSVKKKPFTYDESQTAPENKVERKESMVRRVSKKISKKPSIIYAKDQIDYHYGWVLRKSVYDNDGKPTPRGRRGWKMMYATVRGMVLYLHKDEHGFEAGKFKTYQNSIFLYHSVASIATDYGKKQHVFRLRTANYSEFLFQTSNPVELNKWIDVVNFVAAAFSAPALPMPVSVDYKWAHRRPILPSTPTNLTIPEQLRSHLSKIEEANQAIDDLQKRAPKIQAKPREVQEYFRVERLFLDERERYILYANVLSEKLHHASATTVCSRNNSTKVLPMTKQQSYVTTIPINGGQGTLNGTLSSINGGSIRTKQSKDIADRSAALAEAMAIAEGRIPTSVGRDTEYRDEDRASYREAVQY